MGLSEVQEHVYRHRWDVVTSAHWRKYPNEKCSQVMRVDTLDRRVDAGSRALHTTRLFTGASPVPSFLSFLIPQKPVYAVEHSVVDPERRAMTLEMRSLSFASLLQVCERCTYTEHPENPNWTVFRQEWHCEWNVPSYLLRRLDSISMQRFHASVESGRSVIQELCHDIEAKWDSATAYVTQHEQQSPQTSS
mmetsp:Transcript_8015/g.21248  ORF Transcript_8015/g.21248 Transcript_8015/m.21248 type:complete len:192 (+) Transcript_8015:182-757(+)|eukprot:CAMPEP_0185833484 /NCGR_PEP_ID=MMETSP1353-20130828/2994_1 /TAXON_ID=1077150 /ORGANISM="Erythrolobus australicus, Strain CCMP3124" /LENGTH=191 /DNA_ID=CAMNT_0028531783 /DNA_START=168 /DNA_END=743 /DNA_ORIENTATION=+